MKKKPIDAQHIKMPNNLLLGGIQQRSRLQKKEKMKPCCKAEKWIKEMEARKNRPMTEQEREDRTVRAYLMAVLVVLVVAFGAVPVLATSDPLQSINKLSDFVFAAIKAIGIILLGFGIVQIGLSLKSHDPGQRAQGIMAFFGGVMIAFAKDILDLIIA